MSENCNHDCSSCGEACASRDPKSFIEKPNPKSSIKKVIGVISGKGGVGKSMISSMLAANFQKKGSIRLSLMPTLPVLQFLKHLVSPSVQEVTKVEFIRCIQRQVSRQCQ